MISSRRSYKKEQQMVIVAGENLVNQRTISKEWTGQSMSSLLCIAEDRGRWAVIATLEFPNDVGASRVLFCELYVSELFILCYKLELLPPLSPLVNFPSASRKDIKTRRTDFRVTKTFWVHVVFATLFLAVVWTASGQRWLRLVWIRAADNTR